MGIHEVDEGTVCIYMELCDWDTHFPVAKWFLFTHL